MGFADSFNESLNKTAPVAVSGAMDMIKEKIKLQRDATKTAAVVDTMHEKIMESIESNKELTIEEKVKAAEAASKSMDKIKKAGLDSSEAMTLGKALFPGVFVDPLTQALKQATTKKNEAQAELAETTAPIVQSAVDAATTGNKGADGANTNPNAPIVTGARIGGVDVMFPKGQEQADMVKATSEAKAKQVELSSKASGLVKKLDVLRKQYDEALPNAGLSPAQARMSGLAAVIGAKTGLKPNPKLLALKNNARLQTVQFLRLAGEVGNLAQPENEAGQLVTALEGMTEEERKQAIGQYVEYALSGAPQEAISVLIQDKNFTAIAKDYGLDLNLFSTEASGTDFSSMSDEELRKLAGS